MKIKSDIHKYKKFIVVDENNVPMAWSEDQLCYCTTSDWQDEHFPLEIYSKKEAEKLIKKTIEFRKKLPLLVSNKETYKLMPVK